MLPLQTIADYYTNHFRIEPLYELFGREKFHEIEFGALLYSEYHQKTYFTRNKTFETPEQFIEYFQQHPPLKLYFGARYQKDEPSQSVAEARWLSTTFKFDLDVNDSELIRASVCGCQGKTICNACFNIVLEAVLFLINTLEDDFDIGDPIVYFSGSRGVHVHFPKNPFIAPSQTYTAERDARRSLMYYLNMVKEHTDDNTGQLSARFIHKNITTDNMWCRILNMLFIPYILETSSERLTQLTWKRLVRNKKKFVLKKVTSEQAPVFIQWLKQTMRRYQSNQLFFTQQRPSETALIRKQHLLGWRLNPENVLHNLLTYRYPRFDATPTIDLRKVIKVPMSLDASSGYVVQRIPLEQIRDFSFTLDDLQKISE